LGGGRFHTTNQLKKENTLENYVKISEDALKLSLSHNLLILLDETVSQFEKDALKKVMNELLDALSKNSDKAYDNAYFNFISKFVDNDEVEVRTAQKLVDLENRGDVEGAKGIISMNVEEFKNLPQEAKFQTLFQFLLKMGVEVEKSYKELDMLEAEALNQPVFNG
jgi:hypothetical protein